MKIQSFNPSNLALIRQECNQALKTILDKYGLSCDLGKGTYSSSEFRMKLTINTELAKNEIKINTLTGSINLADIINKQFDEQGKTFKIVDYDARRYKRPIIAEAIKGGGRFVFSLKILEKIK